MPDNHKDPTIIQQIALKRHPGRMSVSFNPPRENPSMVWRSCPVRSCPRTCGVGGIAGESMVVYNSQLRNMLSNPVRACFRKLAGLFKSQSLVSTRIENNQARSAQKNPRKTGGGGGPKTRRTSHLWKLPAAALPQTRGHGS